MATTSLFFWLIEKRQAELEEAQNFGFMNIVYPVYVGAYYIGWSLSLMYYSGHPRDQWNQLNEICKRFEISVNASEFYDHSKFESFLNNGCDVDSLIELVELDPELSKIKYLSKKAKREYLERSQKQIKNALQKMRYNFAKEFRLKYGYSVGDMIYAGWYTNKFIAKIQAHEFEINDDVIEKIP